SSGTLPMTVTVPAVGLSRPARARRSVVLPEPLAPVMARTSPAPTYPVVSRSSTVSSTITPTPSKAAAGGRGPPGTGEERCIVLIRHHHRACGHPPLVVGNPRRRSRLGVEAAPLPHGSPCTRRGDVTYWTLRHIHAI